MSELKLGQDRKYLVEKARYEGLVVFLPEPNEVFLDLDYGPESQPNPRVLQYIQMSLATDATGESEARRLAVVSNLRTISNGGNSHIYLRFNRVLTDLERVILQVCLGSDPIKELFSFIQLHHVGGYETLYCECPVAFFETPKEAEKVIAWRMQ